MQRALHAERNKRRHRIRVPAHGFAVTVLAGMACAAIVMIAVNVRSVEVYSADGFVARNPPTPSAGTTAPTRNRVADHPVDAAPLATPASVRADGSAIASPSDTDMPGLAAILGPLSDTQHRWLREHGYNNAMETGAHTAEDLRLLHANAIAGAHAAIDAYATVAATRGQSDAPHWLEQSAIHGSTLALLRLATWHSLADGGTDRQDAAIAWLLVAQQRGDPLAPTLLAQLAGDGISATARAQAQSLFQRLENGRYRRGLPAFVNQPFPADDADDGKHLDPP